MDFILPCMIGIGHPADNAEYPTQTYPARAAALVEKFL